MIFHKLVYQRVYVLTSLARPQRMPRHINSGKSLHFHNGLNDPQSFRTQKHGLSSGNIFVQNLFPECYVFVLQEAIQKKTMERLMGSTQINFV